MEENELDRVQGLYDSGRFLQAYRSASQADLRAWLGKSARVLAGRLAAYLGAPRLGLSLHLKAWRAHPDDAEVAYFAAAAVLAHRGPLAALQVLDAAATENAPASVAADLLALRSRLHCHYRDFAQAERLLASADDLDGESPWLLVERSNLLEAQDRYHDALAAARKALDVHPWYSPAVQQAGHLLQLTESGDEALELLQAALTHVEHGGAAAQLYWLCRERGRFDDAGRALDDYERLSPLLEPLLKKWLVAQRSDVAYLRGDLDEALALADELGEGFHEKVAANLRSADGDARRVVVPVPFLRQSHQTCGPAVLTMISRFFGQPADHLEVAERICYGGTPNDSQRQWAEQNGFSAREFTLTAADARQLLDRGIPFIVGTVEATNAHVQVVMGYDDRRGTLTVRDPYLPNELEWLTKDFLRHYRASGPRCLALVPQSVAGTLGEVELTDSDLFDLLHSVESALTAHDSQAAYASHAELSERAPDHRITIQSRWALSSYEADNVGVLSCVDRLLELAPDDRRLLSVKLACLSDLERRDARLELLEEAVSDPTSPPVFRVQLAQLLLQDARNTGRVLWLLRTAARRWGPEPNNIRVLADCLWVDQQFASAVRMFRFAACLEDTSEAFSLAYVAAARSRGHREEALAFLRDRFERFAARSGAPAKTLYQALDEAGATIEGFEVLERAMSMRPEDDDLLLFVADARARHGDFEGADRLLERARGKPATRQRTEAAIASYRGELHRAIDCWRKLLELEPVDTSAHQNLAQLLELSEGRQAALDHLRDCAESYPLHRHVQVLYVEWLGSEHAAEAEPLLRELVDRDSADAWARRELALRLADLGKVDEALREVDSACEIDPSSPFGYAVRGNILTRAGDVESAKDALRTAILRSVDCTVAIVAMAQLGQSQQEQRDMLALVRQELERQATNGDGLLEYLAQASGLLEADQLLESLRQLRDARPDLWQSWSAVTRHLLRVRREDQALEGARAATERFPLAPRVWLDLALVCTALSDDVGKVEALEEALAIRPTWPEPLLRLADHHEASKDLDAARALLEKAVSHDPLDARCHAKLGVLLAAQGSTAEARERLVRALRVNPGYRWAYDRLRELVAGNPEHEDEPLALLRELARERAGDAQVWLMLAEALEGHADPEEHLAAVDRAIELRPLDPDPYDLKAQALAAAGRFDEAAAACEAFPNSDPLPTNLRGRLAWIEAERGAKLDAVSKMRALLATETTYSWGWLRLVEWLDALGQHEECAEAAAAFSRAVPGDPVPYGYLGDALAHLGETTRAAEAFERAFSLEPTYEFAGFRLLDLLIEDGLFDEAAGVLARLEQHCTDPRVHLAGIRLAALTRDERAVRERLHPLLVAPDGTGEAARSALATLAGRGMDCAVTETVERTIASGAAGPAAAAAWVRLRSEQGWRAARSAASQLREHPELFEPALHELVQVAVDGRRVLQVERLVRQERDALRASTAIWAQAGWGLIALGMEREAAEWLSDWRDRSDVQPWMLVNLAIALRGIKRVAVAREVSRSALELAPDATTPHHSLLLAVDAFLARDHAGCEELLPTQQFEADDQVFRALQDLIVAATGILDPEGGRRRPSDRIARTSIDRAAPRSLRKIDRTLRTLHRACLRRIARQQRTLAAWLWTALRWL